MKKVLGYVESTHFLRSERMSADKVFPGIDLDFSTHKISLEGPLGERWKTPCFSANALLRYAEGVLKSHTIEYRLGIQVFLFQKDLFQYAPSRLSERKERLFRNSGGWQEKLLTALQIEPDSLKERWDFVDAVATPFDRFDLVIESLNESTGNPMVEIVENITPVT